MRQLLLLVVLAAALTPAAADQPYRVGVLYWSMAIAGQAAMRQGLEAEAERINREAAGRGERGVVLLPRIAGDGTAGIQRQIAQMRELIAAAPDLIVVQPTDSAALVEPVREANAHGIPVVAYDQYVHGGELVSYITSDNYRAGWLDGEYVAARHDAEQPLRLILVEYPQVSSTTARVNGFVDALDAYGQRYKVVKTYHAVEPESGRAAARRMLEAFPVAGSVDVVFVVNDGAGMAIVDALEEAGREEIFVASVDGDPRAIQRLVEGGVLRVDTAQFCGTMGALALRSGYRHLQGEPVAPFVKLPVFPVTAETAARYDGWLGAIPAAFEKPWPSHTPVWDNTVRRLQLRTATQ